MSYNKKVKVILHGYLKKLYPEELTLSGYSIAEVINGFCKQTKAFDVKPDQEPHCISVVGLDDLDLLHGPIPSHMDELHLTPTMGGGKSGGFFKIIVGAVLIAAAFYNPIGAIALTSSLTLGTVLFSAGLSFVLGGLLELLNPTPKIDLTGNSQSDPEASKYLGANQNTVKIGTRIPLLYGRYRVYGHYLSFDVDAVDIAV